MPESVALTVGGHRDDVAELVAWLEAEDTLRGRVQLEPGQVPDGRLGAELSQLAVSKPGVQRSGYGHGECDHRLAVQAQHVAPHVPR